MIGTEMTDYYGMSNPKESIQLSPPLVGVGNLSVRKAGLDDGFDAGGDVGIDLVVLAAVL